MATELLQWIVAAAYDKGLIVAEHAIGQYRWGLIQQAGVATAHANSCMVQEARARAVHPKSKTAAIYKAVLRRGYKGSKSDAPRVYVYNAVGAPKPVVWPRGSIEGSRGAR